MKKIFEFLFPFRVHIFAFSSILLLSNFLPSIIQILPNEANDWVKEDIDKITKITNPVEGHNIIFDHKSKFQIQLKVFKKFIKEIKEADSSGYILVSLGLEEKSNQGLQKDKFKFAKECIRVSGISWNGTTTREIIEPILGNLCDKSKIKNRIERDSILTKNSYSGFKNKYDGIAYKISDAEIFLNKLEAEGRPIVYLDFINYDDNQNVMFSNVNNIRLNNNSKKDLRYSTILKWLRFPPGDNDLYGDKGQNCCP